MSFRAFLILIIFGAVISLLGLGMSIFYFNPDQISFIGFSVFYLSLFLSLTGTIFLVSDWFKSKIIKKQLLFFRLRNSVRHSILFTTLILGWLWLRSYQLLQWWSLVLFILMLVVAEFFFMSLYKKENFYKN